MTTIRRSGGIVSFHWTGKLPDPREEEFAAALQQHRFRTIEDAASEEVSVGWVTSTDPTGGTFAPEDFEAGVAAWLRLRIDKKALPRKWIMIHRDAAEKAAGRKLSARERRELKDDLSSKLLPRVLPTVNLVDALLFADRKLILLMNTSKSVGEQFHKLFFATFALALERGDPLHSGRHCGLDRELEHRLERIGPVRWPQQKRSPEAAADAEVEEVEA